MPKKKDKYQRGTIIHGIAASEALDSSGERLIIKGVDVSSLTKDGTLTFEHENKSTKHIVGKILEAKKIFKISDCENKHHEKFWDKVKIPFIYIKGELLDGVNHESAKDLAAMLRYDQTIDRRKTKPMVNFSIEGGKLDQDGGVIKSSVARKITLTITPCNKTCEAELLEEHDQKDETPVDRINKLLGKTENNTCEIMLAKAEEVPCDLKKTKKKKKKSKKKKDLDDVFMSNVRKALTAGGGLGSAPSGLTNGSALMPESIVSSVKSTGLEKNKKKIKKVLKSLSDDAFKRFNKKDELIKFLGSKLPNLNKNEILAIAKTVAYVSEKKKESQLARLFKADIIDFKTKKTLATHDELNPKPKVKNPKSKVNQELHPYHQSYLQHFDGAPRPQAKEIKSILKGHKRGSTNNPYSMTSSTTHIPISVPNYHAKATGTIGDGAPTDVRTDPFQWGDTKYRAGKRLLEEHSKKNMPVEIHTASDLIGHDDYMKDIPQGSVINFYHNAHKDTSSSKRLLGVGKKLKQAGFTVRHHGDEVGLEGKTGKKFTPHKKIAPNVIKMGVQKSEKDNRPKQLSKDVNFADPKHEKRYRQGSESDKERNIGSCNSCYTKQPSDKFTFWDKDKPICNTCYGSLREKKGKSFMSRFKEKVIGKKTKS